METILIQITNDKALKLLQELEELHLIKLLTRDTGASQKLSEKYAGKLSPATVENYSSISGKAVMNGTEISFRQHRCD